MPKIALSTVKASMERKRKNFLGKADTPKRVKFGKDPEVLEFVIRDYYQEYNAWHGDYPSLKEVSYNDYEDMLTYKPDYDDMMERMKDDYENTKSPELKAHMQLARKLHKRYGGR